MAYYTKAFPKQVLTTPGGITIRFTSIDHDIGVIQTDDQGLIKEIELCIAQSRGGVSRITSEEYLALLSKKNGTLKPRWREEWSAQEFKQVASTAPRIPSQAAEVATAASKPADQAQQQDWAPRAAR